MNRDPSMTCPHCGARLIVDLEAGVIVSHDPPEIKSRKVDFDSKLREVEEGKHRASERMEEAMRREKSKDRLMEDRFQKLMDKAKNSKDTGKPIKDIDLD